MAKIEGADLPRAARDCTLDAPCSMMNACSEHQIETDQPQEQRGVILRESGGESFSCLI
jgi:hypothetical protein